MCRDLSSELAHFDWRKEVELREILIEYSALRSEHFEKVCTRRITANFSLSNCSLPMGVSPYDNCFRYLSKRHFITFFLFVVVGFYFEFFIFM